MSLNLCAFASLREFFCAWVAAMSRCDLCDLSVLRCFEGTSSVMPVPVATPDLRISESGLFSVSPRSTLADLARLRLAGRGPIKRSITNELDKRHHGRHLDLLCSAGSGVLHHLSRAHSPESQTRKEVRQWHWKNCPAKFVIRAAR